MTSPRKARDVKYIPAQMDALTGSSISALHSSPTMLVLRDIRVLLSNLRYLPYIFIPLQSKSDDDELNPFRDGAKVLLLQGWLFMVETLLLSLALPVMLFFPGLYSLFAAVAGLCFIYLMVIPIDGPRIVHSSVGRRTGKGVEEYQDERWIFINGCVVG